MGRRRSALLRAELEKAQAQVSQPIFILNVSYASHASSCAALTIQSMLTSAHQLDAAYDLGLYSD